jgi:C-terminal processing protease CtpA/Prc
VVLGCKIYIKEITGRTVADKDGNLQEGDLISKINGNNIDGLTLKEAR